MMEGIERAARLILDSGYVVALTGAGISVESGIRPFRGPGGLWTEFGEPPMDGYQRFQRDPKQHWENTLSGAGRNPEFARALAEAQPHGAHLALAELEGLGILKYLITQNVDNLHLAAGSRNVAEIHGNFTKLRCIECNARYPREGFEISPQNLPPRCPRCNGVIKGDTVMFGEPIPYDVLRTCQTESAKADCMLSIGTSAFVYPAAAFPQEVKQAGGALIEVDLYETALTPMSDVSLRGKAGEIMPELVNCIKAVG
jgi:NAD-dependent deacetylase